MKRYRDVFTTSEAAKICRVSVQVIIKCFDAGKLKGFKTPTSGEFRRIPRAMLLEFMKEGGIPTDRLDAEELNGIEQVDADVISFQI